jgi:zinc/manganese transport system permease protein
LIWVGWPAIGKIAVAYVAVGLFHYLLRRKFLALTFAPERVGNIKLWDFVFYVTFGIVISLSVEIAGVLMVFTALVIPAVIAFLYTNRFGLALLIAWGAGAVAILSGIGASFYWDLATGPLLVCTFGVTLILAAMLRPLLGIRPGRDIVVASLDQDD